MLRAPKREDDEELNRLVNLPGVRAGTLRSPYTTLASTRQWLEKGAPNGGFNIVAVVDGTVVGLAGLNRYVGRSSHAGMLYMFVHDDHWRDGIGSALLDEVIYVAENWDAVTRIELTAFADNSAAIRLYEKFGFEHEGTARASAFRDGQYCDSVYMARLRM